MADRVEQDDFEQQTYEQLEEAYRQMGELPAAPVSIRGSAPPFPVESLPEWVSDYASRTAGSLQVPTEFMQVISLMALSAACGGRVWVNARSDWSEGTNLYIALVAAPGEGKTPAFKRATSALMAFQRAVRDAYRDGLGEAEAKIAAAEAVQTAADRAVREKPDDDALVAALAAANTTLAEAREAIRETPPTLLIGDATPEETANLLARNDGRLAIITDEGGILDIAAGRYSQSPYLEPFLNGFSNSPITKARVGQGQTVDIERPALTIGIGVQPGHLQRIIAQGGATKERGLLDRFLFVWPESKVGYVSLKEGRTVSSDKATTKAEELYEQSIRAVLDRAWAAGNEGITLTLSKKAYSAFEQWHDEEFEPRRRPGAEWAEFAGAMSKVRGIAVRLAGLLHVAEHALDDVWPSEISAETFERGRDLAMFFFLHLIRAPDLVSAPQELVWAQTIYQWLDANADTQPVVTAKEIYEAHRGLFDRAKDAPSGEKPTERVKRALQILETGAVIKKLPRLKGKVGAPSDRYAVHPELLKR